VGRALIAVVVLAALAGCSAEVASELDERQSREVMAALGRAGIAAERESGGSDGGFTVTVGAKEASTAMAVLEAEGLPRRPEKGLAGLYGSASMIPTATEEKARYIDALGSEIAGHLRQLDGVLDASVIVTAPVADAFAPPETAKPRPTASVLIRIPAGGVAPNETNIAKLVASAAEGLVPEDVTVVMTEAPKSPAASGPSFARVGPISVAQSSKAALQALLGGGLLLVIVLGAWAFVSERRRADLRRRVEALERQARG